MQSNNVITLHLPQSAAASRAEQRHSAARDVIGHSAVQPWSAGSIFPAVLMRVERYSGPTKEQQQADRAAFGYASEERIMRGPIEPRLESVSYTLILDGVEEPGYTYDEAHAVAEALLRPANADLRARRRSEGAEV